MSRACLFCGGQPVTTEHVLATWLQDLDRASGQEFIDRDATVRLPVIDDVPAQ